MPMPRKPKAGPRRDPRPRPTDGLQSYNDVINQKPGHRYVLAAVNDERGGAQYYEFVLGYSPVVFDENDPKCTRLRAGRWKHGEPIMMGMQKLMELGPEAAEQLDAVGYNGNTGQEFADRVEAQILGKGGIDAPSRRDNYFTQASMAKRDDLADTSAFLGAD